MKRSRSRIVLIVLSAVAAGLAVAGAALLFIAYENDFDVSIRHFEFGSVWFAVSLGAVLAGAGVAVACIFATEKRLSFDTEEKYSPIAVFASTLTALMCLFFAAVRIKAGLPEQKAPLYVASIALTVLSAGYFVLRVIGILPKRRNLGLTSLVPALMSLSLLLNLYFNFDEPLNSPLKIYNIVMLVTFMLYFTAEAGIAVGRPKMSRKYAFFSLAAISVGGAVALSRLVLRVADVDRFSFDVIETVFCVIVWIYISASFAEKLFMSRENEEQSAFFNTEDGGKADEDAAEAKPEEEPEAASADAEEPSEPESEPDTAEDETVVPENGEEKTED